MDLPRLMSCCPRSYIEISGWPVSVFLVFQVSDNAGADGRGLFSTFENSITSGAFTLRYRSFNVYGAGDPSISKVFFLINSTQVSLRNCKM